MIATPSQDARPLAAFWIVALIMLLASATSALPSPLYPVYASLWQLTPLSLTIVFGVYVVGILLCLLIAGALSDHIGRRPVLAIALAGMVAALLLFVFANGLPSLIVARVVQGLSIGFSFGATGAALLDNAPRQHPSWATVMNGAIGPASLAVGALASGLLVQFGPAPRQTVYVVFGVLLLASIASLLFVPESSPKSPGAVASLRPRIWVPKEAAPVFKSTVGALISCWALAGMYLSLMPSVVRETFHLTDHVSAGALIATFCGLGAAAGVVLQRLSERSEMLVSLAALVVGSAATATAVLTGSVALLGVGTVIAGVGFGASFQAALRLLLKKVDEDHRAGLIASVYIVSYLALGVPGVIAGALVPVVGLAAALSGYGALVAVIAAITFAMQLRQPHRKEAR